MWTVRHASESEVRLVNGSLQMFGIVKVVSCRNGCKFVYGWGSKGSVGKNTWKRSTVGG